MSEITAEFVRQILDFDAATGVFTWRGGYTRSVRAGRIAGRVNGKGYASISIKGKHRAAHRLAWLHVYGEWPSPEICVDHINGDKTDNRICNLRLATFRENARNRSKVMDRPKGVTFHKKSGKWQSQISPDGKCIFLGLYPTAEEAHAAYVREATRLYGEFARFL